jgi:hypothetical protein
MIVVAGILLDAAGTEKTLEMPLVSDYRLAKIT